MNKIPFPLEPGRQGPEVGDLQAALQLLLDRGAILQNQNAERFRRELSEALRPEREEKVYKDATRRIVSIFQEERRLEPHGRVDEPTAGALNALLREWGLLEQSEAPKSFVVSGRVRRDDGLPFKGGRVRAFHEIEQAPIRLGEDTTDVEGRYTIRYELLQGMASVNLRVEAYDEEGARIQSSEVIRDAKPLEIVDLTAPITSKPSEQRRLEGRVVFDNGLPAEQLVLRLYRLDFGGVATRMSETPTRELGLYVLPFDLGGKAAGLEVRAVDAAGNETPLSKPMHDFGDESRVIVNLVAPAKLQPLAAEYQRLATDLTPHVGEMNALSGARENAERQDLTVLNRATGWDARLIALAANAGKLSADPDVELPQEAVYGLLRAGLPSDKLQLAQAPAAVVEQALTNVREAGIVGLSDAQVAEVKTQFETFANRARLAVPAPGSRSTYGDLLKNSGLDEDAQRKFATIYLNHSRDADLWKSAQDAGLTDGQIQTLQLQGKLAFLSGNSEVMTARLMQRQMTDLSQLAEQDFYRAEKWEDEVKKAAGVSLDIPNEQLSEEDKKKLEALIPTAYAGEKAGDGLRSYTEDMARKVRISYPTQVMARMIEQDNGDEFKLGEARAATAKLLKNAAAEGFKLGQTPVETFVKANPGVLNGIGDVEAATQSAKTLQRLYQITPSDEAMPVLAKLGLTSAYDIAALSQEVFLERYGHKFPTPEQAKLVYRKAQQVSSITYNLFTIAKKLDSEAPVAVISGTPQQHADAKDKLKTALKDYPTMESLFGSMDFCECEHCRTVLSPAAYLVDLLQFIDAEPEVWGNFLAHWKDTHNKQDYTTKYKQPYDALIERRPDIPHIPLTCENTHTALPYIDVVNEILEYYVANEKLTKDAARDTGEATTAELLAEPQNVIAGAYSKLQQALYPLNLPFDLWIETVRQFCDYFETPLWQLLETLRPTDELFAPTQPYDRAAIFIESLGLSPAEYAIFTDPDPLKGAKWYELYGYTTARPAIGNPTNAVNATLTIPDADAAKFFAGDLCTYFDVSADALQKETRTINAIGAAGSGGAGQTTIEFIGVWTTAPPEAGDLLVYDAPATLKSAKSLSRQLGVTYKEVVEIVQTGFVNPKLANLVILYKLSVTIQDVIFYKAHKAFYDQNEDLLGKERADLSAADQQRFDALKKEEWQRLNEVEAFEKRLDDLTAEYPSSGRDFKAWLNDELQNNTFDKILALSDPDAGCNFDLTTLRYANGDPADAIVFLKINLFVRLWRKLGWTIEETDRALQAFMPKNTPFETANLDKQPFKTALIYLAHFKRLDEQARIGKQSRLKLIMLWSDLATTGKKPLYAQLFLTRSVLKSGEVFDDLTKKYLSVFDDPLGAYLSAAGLAAMAERIKHEVSLANVAPGDAINSAAFAGRPKVSLHYDPLLNVQRLAYQGVLTDGDKAQLAALSPSPALAPLLDAMQVKAKEFTLIKGHLLALQGALGLTADDIVRILTDAGASSDTARLSLANVSLLYRYGLLAKTLKLSIRELIALKQLSGLDPFKPLHPDPLNTLDTDHPFSQTLRFVEVVEQVKESGLMIEDLDYLLRHRFDEIGKYHDNNGATLALTKTLSEGVRAIRAEHAVPADPGAMGEDTLRQKLGLALPPEVVERFLSMMNGAAEFTATQPGVQPIDQLKPATFADEPSIRQVSYNAPRQEQKLTFRGVLFEAQKTDLNARFASVVFGALLNDVEKQARLFFDNHLRKQKLRLDGEAGFLDDSDFKTLFEPLKPLLKFAPGDTQQQIDDKLKENEKIEQENQITLQGRRDRIAQAFLPFLQQRLIRQFIVQTMATQLGADPGLVEALLSDARLLGDPQPLLEAITGAGARGVSATFFDGAGAELGTKLFADADTGLKDKDRRPLKPAGANSARFEGYLEAPTPGAYRFYVSFEKKDAEAELRFDHLGHLPGPFLKGVAGKDGAEIGAGANEYVEMKPGAPYRFALDVKNLNGGDVRLLVQGETLPKDSLAQLTLYPRTAIERADRALVLLRKALQLIQSLNLTEREARYLLTHAADFDNLDLSKLPTRKADDTPGNAKALFTQFLRLAGYARLKRDFAGADDDLIGIFETNAIDQVYVMIAKLTRREEATVKATAKALFAAPGFKDELTLRRLWEALQVVERIGAPVASMVGWTRIVSGTATPEQRFDIARDLKEALKARFEPESWQRVAQPIFDRLRQRQRDALVAHVIRQQGFARLEQLYEYFLIDPGMEPVVQTSRIRLAIASVQLFIQRCLINLEKDVPPSVINAKQWEWMKRYRVWEANRKIFLFPENWLEPEFRDDKTHLFGELEGSLLQSDVSSDLVEDAFLNYLKKLEELARLDIVGMHMEDNPEPARRILHVIGRTYSQPHKYFYRRYAQQMWTPWEPVTAEIEGDHLAPVVWRNRLYLFWVKFMEKPEPPAAPASSVINPIFESRSIRATGIKATGIRASVSESFALVGQEEKKLTEMTLSEVTGSAIASSGKRRIEAQLHWSEYLRGEWSTRESGGFDAPSPVFATGVWNFNSHDVFIHVSKEPYENGEERGVYIHLGGAINQSFYLAGRNCAPEKAGYGARGPKPANPYSASSVRATRYLGSGALKVTFKRRITTEDGKAPVEPSETPSILGQGGSYTLLPCDNDITLGAPAKGSFEGGDPAALAKAIQRGLAEIASLMKPVFYQDNTHTFFVEPNVEERTIEEWKEWVARTPQPEPKTIPQDRWKDFVKPMVPRVKLPIPIDPGDPIWRTPLDRESRVKIQPGQDWLLNPATGLKFDGEVIGSGGRTGLSVLRTADVAGSVLESGALVNVHAGSELESGSVVALSGDALDQAGPVQAPGMLNIVGGSGFNSALAQNFDALNRAGFKAGNVGGKLI